MEPGSESTSVPKTTNNFYERQKAMLAEMEKAQQAPPANPEPQPGLPAPPDPSLAAPPAMPPVTPAALPPAAPPAAPAPGGDDVVTLRQQIADLEHRYNSLFGRLEPTQQALASAQRRIEELERERASAPPQPPALPEVDDPELEEFKTVYGDMTPGMKKFVQREILDPVLRDLRPALDTARQQTEDARVLDNRRTFLKPVTDKYPNAADILRSAEFDQYVGSMPPFVADQVRSMLLVPEATGDPTRILGIFDDFTARRVAPPAPPSAPPAPTVPPGTLAADPRGIPTAPAPAPTTPALQVLTPERLRVINATLTGRYGPISAEQRTALMAELDQGEAAAIAMGRGAQVNQTLR